MLEQIKQKVDATPSSRVHHINELNRLGKQTEQLHQSFQQFIVANKKSDSPVDKAEAILQVLSDLGDIKERQQELDLLAKAEGGFAKLKAWRVRCRNATRLFFADSWRVIDVLNYGIFFLTFFIMLKVFQLSKSRQTPSSCVAMTASTHRHVIVVRTPNSYVSCAVVVDKAHEDVANLDRSDPWSDANYVRQFYRGVVVFAYMLTYRV